MEQELDRLEEAVGLCLAAAWAGPVPAEQSGLREAFDRRSRAIARLERLHHKVHSLRFLIRLQFDILGRKLDEPQPGSTRKLRQQHWLSPIFDAHPLDLPRFAAVARLRRGGSGKAEEVSLELGEALFKLDDLGRERGMNHGWRDRGAWWPDYLAWLAHLEKPVAHYLGPPPEGEIPLEEMLAREALSIVQEDRDRRGSWDLSYDLRVLQEPLMWQEVVYRILKDPEMVEGSRTKELAEFAARFGRMYCLKCDELFPVSKNNPGYVVCPKCSAAERQRRHRQR